MPDPPNSEPNQMLYSLAAWDSVASSYGETLYIGGKVEKINLPLHFDFKKIRKTPEQVKEEIKKSGLTKIVGFQTRNPMHKCHDELVKYAMKQLGDESDIGCLNGLDPFFISLAIKKHTGWSFSDVKILYIRHSFEERQDIALRVISNIGYILDLWVDFETKTIYCNPEGLSERKLKTVKIP